MIARCMMDDRRTYATAGRLLPGACCLLLVLAGCGGYESTVSGTVTLDGKPLAEDHSKDPWDFELAPWMESGKLLWIEPGDVSLALRRGLPSPYVDLPGVREEQIIAGGRVSLRLPPDGSPPGLHTGV